MSWSRWRARWEHWQRWCLSWLRPESRERELRDSEALVLVKLTYNTYLVNTSNRTKQVTVEGTDSLTVAEIWQRLNSLLMVPIIYGWSDQRYRWQSLADMGRKLWVSNAALADSVQLIFSQNP